MADPLSAIAGIAGIAVASVQLSNALYQTGDRLTNAPRAIRDVASNMSLLSSILENMDDVLHRAKDICKPRIIQDTVEILNRVKEIQKEVRKIVKRQRGLRGRVGWVFNFGKVSELLDKIEALKSAMNLVLWTIQLAMEQRNANKNAEISVPEKYGLIMLARHLD